MLNKIFRWLLTALGLIIGYFSTNAIMKTLIARGIINSPNHSFTFVIIIIIGIIIFGIIFYAISPFIIKSVLKVTGGFENALQKIPTSDIVIGVSGLIVGLIIAFLLVGAIGRFFSANGTPTVAIIGSSISLVVEVIFGTLGVNVALKKKEDLYNLFVGMRKSSKDKDKKGKLDSKHGGCQPKILDTSVIIDGRIFDILKTDFVEGPIVIPSFVLEELRHIADSSDDMKRTRGRRGLDILNKIQKELSIPVEICEKDYDNIAEVDSKLLKLTQQMNGKVITNDFNLNKVAEFQGVPVLNINELANAVKPVVIPGEEMHIHIVKDGKEAGQGVAYLDDGTMIVVEGGRKYIGNEVDVVVTSVLQTAAGRMIFGKMKNGQDKAV